MKAWFEIFILTSLLPVKACIENTEGNNNNLEKTSVLPNGMNGLEDEMYTLKQQHKDLELKRAEDIEDFERMKTEFRKTINSLDTRLRSLESVVMDQNNEIISLKKGKEEDKKYINQLEDRLTQLEKESVQKFENKYETRNCSFEKRATEDTKSAKITNVRRIQKRLLSPPTTSHATFAFYAYMSGFLPSPNTHQVLVFDDVKTNIGNAYHPSTGLFMVPESGVYVFTWTFRTGAAHDHSIQLLINKEVFGTLYLQSLNGLEAQETGIVVAHVNAGDDVYVRTHATLPLGTADYIQSNSYGRTSFAGWKLF